MRIISGAGQFASPGPAASEWVEQLRAPDLSVGTYSIPAGGVDDQAPHTEDEIYVVMAGRAVIETDSGTAEVTAGSVVYIPAGEAHRFTSITQDLALLVIFGPAYGSRRA